MTTGTRTQLQVRFYSSRCEGLGESRRLSDRCPVGAQGSPKIGSALLPDFTNEDVDRSQVDTAIGKKPVVVCSSADKLLSSLGAYRLRAAN